MRSKRNAFSIRMPTTSWSGKEPATTTDSMRHSHNPIVLPIHQRCDIYTVRTPVTSPIVRYSLFHGRRRRLARLDPICPQLAVWCSRLCWRRRLGVAVRRTTTRRSCPAHPPSQRPANVEPFVVYIVYDGRWTDQLSPEGATNDCWRWGISWRQCGGSDWLRRRL